MPTPSPPISALAPRSFSESTTALIPIFVFPCTLSFFPSSLPIHPAPIVWPSVKDRNQGQPFCDFLAPAHPPGRFVSTYLPPEQRGYDLAVSNDDVEHDRGWIDALICYKCGREACRG
ncbi:hypothetical protein R3P38DRAFT_3223426 [Favolaschia claudopus]